MSVNENKVTAGAVEIKRKAFLGLCIPDQMTENERKVSEMC